ncbi:universal stress protein [Streptomyces sp. GD-15H]|uniref:universal stress protein n=1 Tax=Streptomyces sp. GD-15H TaxID=3129112 RepID=UPI00324FE3B8
MTIPLVVGIDGSEASLEAVDWAAEEAIRHEVPLRLLHAAVRDDEAADGIGAAAGRARKTAPTVPLSSEVLHEDAAFALVGEGRNAFALVLGSRGLGGLSGMLLGSVGLAVAARADCPVVVVRGAAEHRDRRFGNIVVGFAVGAAGDDAARPAHGPAAWVLPLPRVQDPTVHRANPGPHGPPCSSAGPGPPRPGSVTVLPVGKPEVQRAAGRIGRWRICADAVSDPGEESTFPTRRLYLPGQGLSGGRPAAAGAAGAARRRAP